MEQFVELTSIAFLMYRKLTQNQKPDVHSETSYSGVSIHIQKSKKKIQSIIVNMYILHLSQENVQDMLCESCTTQQIEVEFHYQVLLNYFSCWAHDTYLLWLAWEIHPTCCHVEN